MTRKAWSLEELADLERIGPADWASFHALHPHRSYGSWEVRRRRLPSGSAGTRPTYQPRLHLKNDGCWCKPDVIHFDL